MEAKFTPGPLCVKSQREEAMEFGCASTSGWADIRTETSRTIGSAYMLGESENRANAQLWAAAPDLYEALKVAERALLSDPPNGPQKSLYGDGVIYHLDGQTCGHALQVVRAALSKAANASDEGSPQATVTEVR